MGKNNKKEVISWLNKFLRYTDYISASQLYLQDNFFLENKLTFDHIKNRILGHWGTVPGLNVIYAHLNYLIYKHECEILFICGPGHGAPAVLANLFIEGTLEKFYPELTLNKKGTNDLIKRFSWPGGFPSHVTPLLPGSILEGGELGYSLSTSYGAAFDNPDLIVACVVGDGEAESGPMAASWHANKFLNPKTSGAVLPILHVNGYKISNPTIYGTMDDNELKNLFIGYGYEPIFVEDNDTIHDDMIAALENAYQKIRNIQKLARTENKMIKSKWPMIIFRSLKGQTGVKTYHDKKIEGTYRSHGIPLANPKTDKEQLTLVETWLKSYKFTELIDENGSPFPEVTTYLPKNKLRMGLNPHALGGNIRKELNLPDLKDYEIKPLNRGETIAGNTSIGAQYLRDIFKLNAKAANFRFFCPDETESNKMEAMFEATKRGYVWPIKSYDDNISTDGRVTEMLSEHTLQGMYEGYLLTGRHGFFATYEAFAPIVSSMVDQYAKFLKQAMRVDFRPPVSSMNFILTSLGWRQDHNGFSHQNPSFISNVLEKHGEFCSVYLPADANMLILVLEDCLKRTNAINVIVSSKQPIAQWLTLNEARQQMKEGIMAWDFIDPEGTKNPDIIMSSAGDHITEETLAAICLLKHYIPELKIRYVNVSELTALGVGDECHSLGLCEINGKNFYKYFTEDKPIIFSFHGYPATIHKLTWGHEVSHRMSIHGYLEEGTTTTPFDLLVDNKISRYHLAIDAIQRTIDINPYVKAKANELITLFEQKIKNHEAYIVKYGKDSKEIECFKFHNK
ncbi:MAG: phosphoketolase [Candidatus Peregrinibacteria bacterium GW2011_GWF2_33_10]|nr:MAG: phosphoketolase [Candidatus Peregrinibacteria bacterium GW2011_GWF2_33_10]OGJ44256.1 MAG: hypothetical protein A2272_04175 [Candidatus Peregrinibacteria bacterium RIFOXYA12_FULL_33_12]OGJ44914.1 MAG: hypothetical protein A2263_03240 [Candidatus Peregrinibacteria bacterium RIFOXYA2_FULL_33_21]OGJ50673.1 MAG: hypothetical protein A2307_03530 [Candidatus Peregrinibacteria bacterium RIFOXYB2_FULL_33_20]